MEAKRAGTALLKHYYLKFHPDYHVVSMALAQLYRVPTHRQKLNSDAFVHRLVPGVEGVEEESAYEDISHTGLLALQMGPGLF